MWTVGKASKGTSKGKHTEEDVLKPKGREVKDLSKKGSSEEKYITTRAQTLERVKEVQKFLTGQS